MKKNIKKLAYQNNLTFTGKELHINNSAISIESNNLTETKKKLQNHSKDCLKILKSHDPLWD